MWQLSCQWGGDGVKVELLAAIVDWHLPPFPMAEDVAVALSHGSGGQTMCM